ncbi:MAG TPA: pyridoxamine 5'-phosphate oxidase family protein [Nitrolancea sp.]|nr:pyridoxamine 5'-phosphate oxidase family protein [Nitrolancea sp.]
MLGEMTVEQIDRLLRSEAVGRIGCYADGRVYIVPVTYAYDGSAIYVHSFEGRKIRMMRENPNVCFEVERIKNLANWQSVIAYGRFEELAGEDAARGMERLMERFMPHLSDLSVTMLPEHATTASVPHGSHQAVIYRIAVVEKSGRFEKR